MGLLQLRKIPLSSFLTFDSTTEPVYLVDVTNDVSANGSTIAEFLKSPGSFVYETKFVIDELQAQIAGVKSVNFDFYRTLPSPAATKINNASFSVAIEPSLKKDAVIGTSANGKSLTASSESTKEVLVSATAPGYEKLAAISPLMTVTSVEQPTRNMPFFGSANMSESHDRIDPAEAFAAGIFLSTTPSSAISFGIKNRQPRPDDRNFERLSSSSFSNDDL